jgi:hypothetical protein
MRGNEHFDQNDDGDFVDDSLAVHPVLAELRRR